MSYVVRLELPVDVATARARLWDAQRHAARIPLTRLDVAGRLDQVGLHFTATTGLGPLAVADRMIVTVVDFDNGACRVALTKTGRVLRGDIDATLTPTEQGSRLVWRQELRARALPRVAQPLLDAIARRAYAHTLHRILAE